MTISPISPLADIPFLGGSIPAVPAAQATQTPATQDFASVLTNMASQTAADMKTAENMAIQGLQGQAPVQDVVQAVMKAQTSLQTALAIRDKAVSAYQDLTRMTI